MRSLLFIALVLNAVVLPAKELKNSMTAELIHILIGRAQSSATLEEFVKTLPIANFRQTELLALITKNGVRKNRPPKLSTSNSEKGELHIALEGDQKLTVKIIAEPKPHLIVGSKKINLQEKTAAQIFSEIEATQKSARSAVDFLVPQAHALAPLLVVGFVVTVAGGIFAAEQHTNCNDLEGNMTSLGHRPAVDRCLFRRNESVIALRQPTSCVCNPSDHSAEVEIPYLGRLQIKRGENSFEVTSNYRLNGAQGPIGEAHSVGTCKFTVRSGRIVGATTTDRGSYGCTHNALGESALDLLGVHVDRYISCCGSSTCRSQVRCDVRANGISRPDNTND